MEKYCIPEAILTYARHIDLIDRFISRMANFLSICMRNEFFAALYQSRK